MALSSDVVANLGADKAMEHSDIPKMPEPKAPKPRRRSSTGLFNNLEHLKQPTSDEDKVRRASMSDQHPQGGRIFNMFNKWVGANR